jgi:hypothetical protein
MQTKQRPAEILGWSEVNGKPVFEIACFRVNHAKPGDGPAYHGQLCFRCPFCGEQHFHGAVGPKLGAGDGHRVAHCLTRSMLNSGGYVLVEQEHSHKAGTLPKRLLGPAERHNLKQFLQKNLSSQIPSQDRKTRTLGNHTAKG